MITFRYTKWTNEEQEVFVEEMADLLCTHIIRTRSKQIGETDITGKQPAEKHPENDNRINIIESPTKGRI